MKPQNQRFPITLFQDTDLKIKKPNDHDSHDLPGCLERKNENASLALFLPITAKCCNTAEKPLCCGVPFSTAGIYRQTTSHVAEPHRNRNGEPREPQHCQGTSAAELLQQFPHCRVPASPSTEFLPRQPRADTQVLPFSVTTLSSSKKTSQPYYHQHLQLINLADLGPRVQKFSRGGMRI